jgi:transposase
MSLAKSKTKLKGLAERMFIEDGMTAKAVSETIGVTEKTIGNWRRDGNWDDKRKTFLATPHNIKRQIANELSKLVSGEKGTLEMKAINEAIRALQQMTSETSTEVVFTVFREFDNWMADQDPQMAITFLEWHKLFLLQKAQQEV